MTNDTPPTMTADQREKLYRHGEAATECALLAAGGCDAVTGA